MRNVEKEHKSRMEAPYSYTQLFTTSLEQLPENEICKRTISFARSCINHESNLVRFISYQGVFY